MSSRSDHSPVSVTFAADPCLLVDLSAAEARQLRDLLRKVAARRESTEPEAAAG